MFHLIYTSHAVHPMSESELVDLLKESRSFNSIHNITGMLLYVDGKFMQVLEGDETEVLSLYENIRRDPRHRRVATIVEGHSEDRVFKNWSMGFKSLSSREAKSLSNFHDLDSFFTEKGNTSDSGLLMVFLKLFYIKNMVDFAEV
ncbi:MAG: BLUF domain-containing protein [Bacteroidetes bacterium]|nr:BLUF domain-containing protein [Bacteroidota bacterium]